MKHVFLLLALTVTLVVNAQAPTKIPVCGVKYYEWNGTEFVLKSSNRYTIYDGKHVFWNETTLFFVEDITKPGTKCLFKDYYTAKDGSTLERYVDANGSGTRIEFRYEADSEAANALIIIKGTKRWIYALCPM